MLDSYGRQIDYLRISITDRCNLRCVYCMPEEGMTLTTHKELLSFDEIIRLCRIMAKHGLKKIKLTGGEPLVRKDIEALVRGLKSISGIEKVTLTTNGILLEDKIKDLADAGIDGINVSLDTIDPKIFQAITRRDELGKVLAGIETVLAYPKISLKINCVPMGIDDENLMGLLSYAREYPIHVRFIEMMPIGMGKDFVCQKEESILSKIKEWYGNVELCTEVLGNGPCHYYKVPGFVGKIGFISAISHKFCDQCNRVRLTSQGYLKTCLQYEIGGDLKLLLRNGSEDDAIWRQIQAIIEKKPQGHAFLSDEIKNENELCMSQIGG